MDRGERETCPPTPFAGLSVSQILTNEKKIPAWASGSTVKGFQFSFPSSPAKFDRPFMSRLSLILSLAAACCGKKEGRGKEGETSVSGIFEATEMRRT